MHKDLFFDDQDTTVTTVVFYMHIVSSLEQFRSLSREQQSRSYIPESITTVYPIEECGEAFVELAMAPKKFLRAKAAEQLSAAQAGLQERTNRTCTLKITDAFRPLALQRTYFRQIEEQIREREGLEGKALWERVTQFIADPTLCPPHTTGGAVDLTIMTTTGKELDMGTPVDAIDDRAYTWHTPLSSQAKKNRELLVSVMTQSGFVNLVSEWWHYSFGDQYWAIVKGASAAIYGSCESEKG